MNRMSHVLAVLLVSTLIITSCNTSAREGLNIDVGEIDRISIERFDESLILERSGGEWFVVAPVRTMANPVTVENLLITLSQLTIEDHVTRDPVDYAQHGVGESAWIVTVNAGDDTTKIAVGRAGRDFETQHIRIDDSEDVVLARGRINTTMRVDVWRHRLITDIDPSSIAHVEFETPNGDWKLESSDSSWVLTGPDTSHPVQPERFSTWASFLNPLTTDRFAQVTREIVLDNAQRKITIELVDGTTHELQFLDLQGEWGIVVDDKETVFQIFALRVNNLFPDLLTFE
ncbi:MAG: DUF4340 domain-containing protein [Rhodothermales bacterium]|nr:DUF4340 domain-containing protein [Rhodothermales bacterium]